MLMAAGYFEAVAFTRDDRERASVYEANAARVAAVNASGDIDGYLASLDMVCTIWPVDGTSRARVAQLINKSNQYNLTTRRYTEAQVEAMESDAKRYLSQVRLVDKFGDNGIISVLVADRLGEVREIDTWLMSSRVLGRRVQEAALAHLAAATRANGAARLVGRYIPSPKNAMVREHGGATTWTLDLTAYAPPELPLVIDDTSAPAVK